MVSQRFLVLLVVENKILKVYQNPPSRKLLNWGGAKMWILWMNNYLPYNKTTVWEEPAKGFFAQSQSVF